MSSRVQCERIRAALRCLRRSRPTCRRLASNTAGLRPLPCSPVRWLLVQPCHRPQLPGSRTWGTGEANAEGKTKGCGTCRPAKPVCTWGWRDAAASPPCRVGREARADAGMSACFARTRQNLQEHSHDRPPRRRFPHPSQRPENRGQSCVSRYSSRRARPAAVSPRCAVLVAVARVPAPASGPAHAGTRPHGGALRGAKLTSMSRRVTIKTLLLNQHRASPQSLAKHGGWGAMELKTNVSRIRVRFTRQRLRINEL